MAQPHQTDIRIVNADHLISDILGAPLDSGWTVEGLAERVLTTIAARLPDENLEFVLDADTTSDRQTQRLLRPVLACLAKKSAAESATTLNLYGGRLVFERPGPNGSVWILGHFDNRAGSVRVTLRRTSSPREEGTPTAPDVIQSPANARAEGPNRAQPSDQAVL